MGNGLFVTGTGTDVGKTLVTSGLLRMLRQSGMDAVTMKPVQTGCTKTDQGWIIPDLEAHWAAAEYAPANDEREWMAPYCYEPACSPHLAGAQSGRYPDIARIHECYSKLADRHDGLLVEGAGGILVPLDDSHTLLDLMRHLGLPVLLVGMAGLGTINHTLLSVEVLRNAGLTVAGVVLSETVENSDSMIHADNPHAISRFGDVDILGQIPWIAQPDASLDWDAFSGGMTGFETLRKFFQ